MVASGSEVSTLFEGAKLLEERKHINIQIVSAPSEGLFRNSKSGLSVGGYTFWCACLWSYSRYA